MKLRLSYEILKNFGRLLSFDFWKAAIKDPFTALQIIWLVTFVAFADVFKMIFVPGYPPKPGAAE